MERDLNSGLHLLLQLSLHQHYFPLCWRNKIKSINIETSRADRYSRVWSTSNAASVSERQVSWALDPSMP